MPRKRSTNSYIISYTIQFWLWHLTSWHCLIELLTIHSPVTPVWRNWNIFFFKFYSCLTSFSSSFSIFFGLYTKFLFIIFELSKIIKHYNFQSFLYLNDFMIKKISQLFTTTHTKSKYFLVKNWEKIKKMANLKILVITSL